MSSTVAQLVGATLAELGVGHAFGVVGSGNFAVTNALIAAGVPFVAARHEGGAATMADAYSRLSALPAVADTVRAYRTAVRERRTVVLSLPLDVQEQAAPDWWVVPLLPPIQRVRPDAGALTSLVELLERAERPVFVAGRGARDAGPQIATLAERTGALVATSAVANGLFEGNPFSLGISGGFSCPLTAELIAGADLIVGWGCALNMWTMRHGSLIGADATVVQVDVEDEALGANRPIDLGVLGDCRETAAAALGAVGPARVGYRSDTVRERIAAQGRWTDVEFDDLSTATTIDPRLLSRELDAILPRERTVSVDSGNFMGYPSAYLAVPDEFGFNFTQAFQSIGLGLATAIGTALAQPDRLPVAALGDGGFLMGISELETVVRLGLPMVLVVYNDSAYGAEVHHFDAPGTDHSAVTFPDTDIATIARGYGAEAVTVRSVADLDAVREWVAGPRNRPLLIDAKVSSDGGAWWLAEAFKGH
ncbi:thiamine pyrophosphate-dependent enzyme [Rhodococcus sp. PAM 2766]|uniref:acetolactate synthase n=1 Tax=Rhodococcus parequi TaxID=3137122 RepID=A0ABW9FHQ4_9NOCA